MKSLHKTNNRINNRDKIRFNQETVDNIDKGLFVQGERDPIFFAEFFLGIKLNAFQQRALLSLINHKQIIWVTANQVGKTVTIAISQVWFNFYKRGFDGDPAKIDRARYETLNISPVARQSKEALRYVEEILASQFSWEVDGERYLNECKIGWFWKGVNKNVGKVYFSNNSIMWCLSTSSDQGAGLAGKQFAYISYDECVQSLHLEDELSARIFSRTAKYSGWVLLVSTPDDLGKSQQYWYHLYTAAKDIHGDKQWFLVEGLYFENIFIPRHKRIEYMKRLKKLSPQRYLQVIKGSFLASSDRMFTPEIVEGLWNGLKEPIGVIDGHLYVLVIDWGVADSGDETVMVIADITDIDNVVIVKAYRKQGGDPVELVAMANYLAMDFNDAAVVLDVAEMGGVIFKKMMKQFHPIGFTGNEKADALMFLKLRLQDNIRKDLTETRKSVIGTLKSYYLPKLERQLSSYKIEDHGIKQDWVMVAAMLAWYLERYKKINKTKSFSLSNFYK